MPDLSGRALSQEEFYELDYRVMGIAFSVHNELGPFFCDEQIYQRELGHRLEKLGIADVRLERPIEVSFRGVKKFYFADLMLNDAAVYELKAAETLHPRHTRQALTYLLLTGLRHGKLINMHPSRVEHRFVSTRLNQVRRREFDLREDSWRAVDEESDWLKSTLVELVEDLGLFLGAELYTEMLAELRGGAERGIVPIGINCGSRTLGRQMHPMLNAETGFRITAITKHVLEYEAHLRRFLQHTSMKTLQWINLNHHVVELRTLLRK